MKYTIIIIIIIIDESVLKKQINFFFSFLNFVAHSLTSVSHTTDDMIFQWDPSVPLVVDDNIELPQLALVQNHTADCNSFSFFLSLSISAETFVNRLISLNLKHANDFYSFSL